MTTTQAGKTSAITKHQKGATYFFFNNYYNYLFSSSVCASNSTIDSTLKKKMPLIKPELDIVKPSNC